MLWQRTKTRITPNQNQSLLWIRLCRSHVTTKKHPAMISLILFLLICTLTAGKYRLSWNHLLSWSILIS